MQDAEQAVATMKELQSLGVQLSIDDFGTGYSSLSALKRFPVGRLKIDKSFIDDLPDDENDRAVASAVISLGQKLNLRVIAEGVETEAQAAFLRENNCDEMQGYHLQQAACRRPASRSCSPRGRNLDEAPAASLLRSAISCRLLAYRALALISSGGNVCRLVSVAAPSFPGLGSSIVTDCSSLSRIVERAETASTRQPASSWPSLTCVTSFVV